MPSFDGERAALVLLDAIALGDTKAAEKWDVSTRSIRGWRKRLEGDSVFAAFFLKKKEMWEKGWAHEIPGAIRSAIAYLSDSCRNASPGNAEVMKEANNMVKILAEVEMSKAVIDARLSRQT